MPLPGQGAIAVEENPRLSAGGQGRAATWCFTGVDTIDATAVDTSLFGHTYYGDSGTVLTDIFAVLHDAKPAEQHRWLRTEFLGMQKYWVFQR